MLLHDQEMGWRKEYVEEVPVYKIINKKELRHILFMSNSLMLIQVLPG